MAQKTFTLDEVKSIAFFAVQYATRLENHGLKTIKKVHIDNFIEVETETIPISEFAPPVENFKWFKKS